MKKLADSLLPVTPSWRYLVGRNLLLIGLCIYLLLQGFLPWLEYRLEPSTSIARDMSTMRRTLETSQADPDKPGPALDTDIIVQRNIFGGDPREPEGGDKEEEDISLEKIPLAQNLQHLQLIGTIVGSDRTNWAIIENKKKRRQELYTEGEKLNSARIKKILRNNVVVNDGKRDEVMSIDYKIRDMLDSQSSGAAGPEEQAAEPQAVTLDKGYVQESLANVQNIFQQARIMPYMQEGKPIGFQVSNIQGGSFFDELQLQNGDVILSAGGRQISSPQDIMGLASRLQQDRIEMTIRRDGEEMSLEYELR